jgi:4-nitrophenyl phosphatase
MTLERQPKGFMFDLDGTLILSDRSLGGYTAIPGAAEALAALDARGVPWIAMTNGSAYPASVQAPKLRAVGLPVPDERLFTPNSVAGKAMVERGYDSVLVLGTPGVVDALEEMGVPSTSPGTPNARCRTSISPANACSGARPS